jgi:hypothetical protein
VFSAIEKYGKKFFNKKILKNFSEREDALLYEILLHEKFNVDVNEKFFNRSKQSIWGFNCTGSINKGKTYEEILGVEKAKELKKLRSEKAKGKDNSGKNNPMYGKKHTDDIKEKHSKRMSGKNHPTYGYTWITNGIINKKVDLKKHIIENGWYEGRIMKMLSKPKEKQPCLHCFKLFDELNMKRWHGDNCKSLKDRLKEILTT